MMSPRSYFLPACVSVALFAILFYVGSIRVSREPRHRDLADDYGEIISLPHGRVLCVIVDVDGIYVGDQRIPFGQFGAFLKIEGREMKPDYAIIHGTEFSHYGHAVEAFVAVRDILKIEETISTFSLPVGTRREAIEFYEHYWDYSG